MSGADSRAYAVNDRDQVVGSSRTAAGKDHAFLWQHGVMTDLGALDGDYSFASDINDRGQLVASSFVDSAPLKCHAFLWARGVAIDLGASSAACNYAYRINNLGQVAGSSTAFAYDGHAVLWNGSELYLPRIQQ